MDAFALPYLVLMGKRRAVLLHGRIEHWRGADSVGGMHAVPAYEAWADGTELANLCHRYPRIH